MNNIIEKNEGQHSILCVGYCTHQIDADKEFISDEKVLKSAVDEFLKNPRYNLNHSDDEELTGIEVISSEITKKGQTINGQYVAPGCWLLKLKIDDDSWPLIFDGSGVSIQGKAEYEEISQ